MPLRERTKRTLIGGIIRVAAIAARPAKTIMLRWFPDPLPDCIASLRFMSKGFPGASDLRAQLMTTKSTDEVRRLLAEFHANKAAGTLSEEVSDAAEEHK